MQEYIQHKNLVNTLLIVVAEESILIDFVGVYNKLIQPINCNCMYSSNSTIKMQLIFHQLINPYIVVHAALNNIF